MKNNTFKSTPPIKTLKYTNKTTTTTITITLTAYFENTLKTK